MSNSKKTTMEEIKEKLDSLRPENLIDQEKYQKMRENERRILQEIFNDSMKKDK